MTHAILVAAIVLGAADAPADDDASDLTKMQGDWMVVSMTVGGMKLSDDEAQTLFRSVEGERYVVSRFSKPVGKGAFKIDATKTPRTIDSTPEGPAAQAGTIRGIYEFEGDTLRICNAPPGKPRPTDFEAKPASGHTLTVWTREKS
jgi:uncharacterized protein (TIGR03067 family)